MTVAASPGPRTVLLVNPNMSKATTDLMVEAARPWIPDGIALRSREAARGAAMIVEPAALALAADEVVRIGLEEAPRCRALVVAAFGDPGVVALRARLSVPVVGIAEAAMAEAAAGGRRFGIATTTPALLPAIADRVRQLGWSDLFTGFRLPAGDALALAAAPDEQEAELARAVARCLHDDGADAVIIGGGPLSETAARLCHRFGDAVVAPVPAGVRAAVKALTA